MLHSHSKDDASSSKTCSSPVSYVINPNSLSKTSKIDLEAAEIVTNICEEDKNMEQRTPLMYLQVPKPVCTQVEVFFCCIDCGKVYWEGQHFGNVLSTYNNIISK